MAVKARILKFKIHIFGVFIACDHPNLAVGEEVGGVLLPGEGHSSGDQTLLNLLQIVETQNTSRLASGHIG